MTKGITISLLGPVGSGQNYAAHLIAEVLERAGADVELDGVLPRRELSETALNGVTARIHLAPECIADSVNTMTSTPAFRIAGAVLLVLLIGSAEIRLAFPPILDLLLLAGIFWWFWRKISLSHSRART